MKRQRIKKEQKHLTESKFRVFETTFEKHMANIAKSFSRIDERLTRHDKAFELVLKQMQQFTEEAREHRQTMSSLMHTDISQERTIEDLKIRVERIEAQIK